MIKVMGISGSDLLFAIVLYQLLGVHRHLGIDPTQTFADFSGRPRYILEEREVIREILA